MLVCLILGISREEASKLGSQRREELRRQRDFDSTAIGQVKTLLQVREASLYLKQFCCMGFPLKYSQHRQSISKYIIFSNGIDI